MRAPVLIYFFVLCFSATSSIGTKVSQTNNEQQHQKNIRRHGAHTRHGMNKIRHAANTTANNIKATKTTNTTTETIKKSPKSTLPPSNGCLRASDRQTENPSKRTNKSSKQTENPSKRTKNSSKQTSQGKRRSKLNTKKKTNSLQRKGLLKKNVRRLKVVLLYALGMLKKRASKYQRLVGSKGLRSGVKKYLRLRDRIAKVARLLNDMEWKVGLSK